MPRITNIQKDLTLSKDDKLLGSDKTGATIMHAFYLKLDIPFWFQYIDKPLQTERDYYMHLNYLHQNCVKHGLTEELWDYEYSSIHEYKRKFLTECFEKYPITDFEPIM